MGFALKCIISATHPPLTANHTCDLCGRPASVRYKMQPKYTNSTRLSETPTFKPCADDSAAAAAVKP